jgi:hypothetical protein
LEQHHFGAKGRDLEMADGMLLQGIGWSLLAIGVGTGVGLARAGFRGVPQAASGALMGGGVASLLYVPVAGFLYVQDYADKSFPDGFLSDGSTNQLFWAAMAGGLIGFALSASLTLPGADRTNNAASLPPELSPAG